MERRLTGSQRQCAAVAPHPFPYQGSKRRLAPTILQLLPCDTDAIIEPFAGSAAVSVAARHAGRARRSVIGDVNAPLVNLWRAILEQPGELADRYSALWEEQRDDPSAFYSSVRDRFNVCGEPAMLLYLLNRCVKAAVRYSAAGEFNQSADRRRLGARPETVRARLAATSSVMRGTRAVVAGYEGLLLDAGPCDVVYLDPPYQGVSGAVDRRYVAGLPRADFEQVLGSAIEREISFIVSYDGVATTAYGEPLSAGLGLTHFNLLAGRSAQATLHGRDTVTTESIYLSPALLTRLQQLPGAELTWNGAGSDLEPLSWQQFSASPQRVPRRDDSGRDR